MSDSRGEALLTETLEAHGGLKQWSAARTIHTDTQVRGLMPTLLFPGRPLDDYRYSQTVQAQRLHNVLSGFPDPDVVCTFTPEEVTAERDGHAIARRANPRAAFYGIGAARRLPRWDILDSAYFLGYAMSNYLTHPYIFAREDIEVRRGADAQFGPETWRRLEVTHPDNFASHCKNETFFIDERGLIRRHEYAPDILVAARKLAGTPVVRRAFTAAHLTSRHREFNGLVFPTFRRVVFARPGGPTLPGVTIICAQLTDVTVSYASTENHQIPEYSRVRGNRSVTGREDMSDRVGPSKDYTESQPQALRPPQ